MGFDTRGSVQSMPPFTCSKISRLKRREIFLLSQLLANAEENLSIFRYLLQISRLKRREIFLCSYNIPASFLVYKSASCSVNFGASYQTFDFSALNGV